MAEIAPRLSLTPCPEVPQLGDLLWAEAVFPERQHRFADRWLQPGHDLGAKAPVIKYVLVERDRDRVRQFTAGPLVMAPLGEGISASEGVVVPTLVGVADERQQREEREVWRERLVRYEVFVQSGQKRFGLAAPGCH